MKIRLEIEAIDVSRNIMFREQIGEGTYGESETAVSISTCMTIPPGGLVFEISGHGRYLVRVAEIAAAVCAAVVDGEVYEPLQKAQ